MASASEWSKRVAEWRSSGLSAPDFAARRGLAAATLRWWSSRLGRVETENGQPEIRLARVVRTRAAETAPIVIEVGSARVLVPVGADAATLTCPALASLAAARAQIACTIAARHWRRTIAEMIRALLFATLALG